MADFEEGKRGKSIWWEGIISSCKRLRNPLRESKWMSQSRQAGKCERVDLPPLPLLLLPSFDRVSRLYSTRSVILLPYRLDKRHA